jgi:hypothetical protein
MLRAALALIDRAGLAQELRLRPVPRRWLLRLAGADPQAIRIQEILDQPWSRRLPVLWREIMPTQEFLRLRDPTAPMQRRRDLLRARAQRLLCIARGLPRTIQSLRQIR